MLLTFIFEFTGSLQWTKIYVLNNLSNCGFTTRQYQNSGIDPFVDGQSAISPSLGGLSGATTIIHGGGYASLQGFHARVVVASLKMVSQADFPSWVGGSSLYLG